MIKSSDDYDEKYIKIKFDLDGDLPLNETLEIQNVTMIVRAVFYKNSKYYRQVLLDERLYKLWIIWKCYILIELTFFKELMLIKKLHQKSAIIRFSWIKVLSFNRMTAIDVMIY